MKTPSSHSSAQAGFDVRYEHCEHLGGMAHVIYRDGSYVGASMTEAGAREAAALIAEFGYFDPTEPRQRLRLRNNSGEVAR